MPTTRSSSSTANGAESRAVTPGRIPEQICNQNMDWRSTDFADLHRKKSNKDYRRNSWHAYKDQWQPQWIIASQSNSSQNTNPGRTQCDLPRKDKEHFESFGFQLCDYDGKWAPAPIDWESRPAFQEFQSEERIWEWLDEEFASLGQASERLVILKSDTAQDIAPRNWIPLPRGYQSADHFWCELITSALPQPLGEGDLKRVAPFWKVYENEQSSYLLECSPPRVLSGHPEETIDEKMRRACNRGSLTVRKNQECYIRLRDRVRAEQRDKIERRQRAIARQPGRADFCAIVPKSNISVRMASSSDVADVTSIFAAWVTATRGHVKVDAPTQEPITARWQKATSNGLPVVVAIERAGKHRPQPPRRGRAVIVPAESVAGVVIAEPEDTFTADSDTVRIRMLVRSDSIRKRIAKCLLDKMIGLLDPTYHERGGYDIEDARIAMDRKISRVVQKIVFAIPSGDDVRFSGLQNWLVNFMGFKQQSSMESASSAVRGPHVAMFERVVERGGDSQTNGVLLPSRTRVD